MRTSRKLPAFTFPETIALVGVIALMAGLAAQLLLLAQGFSVRIEGEQSRLQTALRVRTEVARWAEAVKPAWWADPARVFTMQGDMLVVTENPGGEGRVWRVQASRGVLRASTDDGPSFTWGPLEGVSVEWWTKDSRVLGLEVEWSGSEHYRLVFPWGGRPL